MSWHFIEEKANMQVLCFCGLRKTKHWLLYPLVVISSSKEFLKLKLIMRETCVSWTNRIKCIQNENQEN